MKRTKWRSNLENIILSVPAIMGSEEMIYLNPLCQSRLFLPTEVTIEASRKFYKGFGHPLYNHITQESKNTHREFVPINKILITQYQIFPSIALALLGRARVRSDLEKFIYSPNNGYSGSAFAWHWKEKDRYLLLNGNHRHFLTKETGLYHFPVTVINEDTVDYSIYLNMFEAFLQGCKTQTEDSAGYDK